MKNKDTSKKKVVKNQSFKSKVIINYDDFEKKFPNIIGIENEITQLNNQYNKTFHVLFNKDKFKIRNDFDSEHSNEFLKEKEKYLQPVNLDGSLSDDDEEEKDILNRISPKFTFGLH